VADLLFVHSSPVPLFGTAAGVNPAPGALRSLAFSGSPKTIPSVSLAHSLTPDEWNSFGTPPTKHSLGWGAATLAPSCPSKGQKEETLRMINQLTLIGFLGKNAEVKFLSNGTPVCKFSIATTKSWRDDAGQWQQKTQWHNVVGYGKLFEQLSSRLVKGTHLFVQGELTTREYERTIQVPNGKRAIEHVIKQLAVELKADTIRILDRNSPAASDPAESTEEPPA